MQSAPSLSPCSPRLVPVGARPPRRPLPPRCPTARAGACTCSPRRAIPAGTLWVGTYGQGIYRLPTGAAPGSGSGSDTTAGALVAGTSCTPSRSALAVQIWYGTVGNGWGLSTDGGRTWKNWTYDQLGPEWQYVAAGGIATRGDTTVVATADGLQITTDDGAHWTAIGDSVGPPARGPADTALPLLTNEYVRRLARRRRGWNVTTLRGDQRLRHTGRRAGSPSRWRRSAFRRPTRFVIGAAACTGARRCGLRPAVEYAAMPPADRRRRPEAPAKPLTRLARAGRSRATDNAYIDQTYRYGSTMGGNFQQHQGVEFNNPDGTPVLAALGGTVVYAGRAEAGALTVAIRHDTTVTARRHDATGSTPSTTTTARWREGGRPGQDRAGDLPRRQHRPRDQRPSPPRARRLADRLDRRDRGFAAAVPAVHDQSRALARAAARHRHRGGAGARRAPARRCRRRGSTVWPSASPTETPFSYAETYGDKAPLAPALRRALRGERRAGGHLRGRNRDRAERRCSAR